jgi:AraC-like DNA-binding protein
MIDGRIAPGFACLSIAVPATVWEDTRALAGLERRGAMGASVHFLDEDAFKKIEARIRNLRALLEMAVIDPQWITASNSAAMEFSKDLLICAWTGSGATHPFRDSLRNRARLARRAEDWMRAHLGESITIPEVCRALGVSRREIEYAFRLIHDESPRDYLQALRLNAIRHALICGRSDQSISHLALAHGVTHLSRFAANYRRMFGESPTETRKV